MAYAGMGAHYNTFQLKGKQEDSIGQNRSIIALDHLQLVIPYLAATYLMLLEMSEQPKWLGLSFRNGFKQALGQSRDFLTICMLQLNLTNAPNTCSIFQQCCPLAANARYKTMHNTTATTVLSQENTPYCTNSMRKTTFTWTTICMTLRSSSAVSSFLRIGSPPEAWKGLFWWLRQVKLPQLCKLQQRFTKWSDLLHHSLNIFYNMFRV